MVNKKKKINYLPAAVVTIGIIALVSVLGNAVAVKADAGGFWDNVADKLAAILSGRVDDPQASDQAFGGSTSADWNVGGNLTTDGSFDLDGLTSYVSTGTFADATTTLACEANPFSATSTADFGSLLVTGPSTTTISLYMATSSVSTGRTTSTISGTLSIIQAATVAANSTGIAFSGINNALTGTYAAGSVQNMIVGADEYVCVVAGDGSGATAGVTNAANTFAGSYKIRWTK